MELFSDFKKNKVEMQNNIDVMMQLLKIDNGISEQEKSKIALLYDWVLVMVSESTIDFNEYLNSKNMALGLGINSQIIDDMIKIIIKIDNILPNLDKQKIQADFEAVILKEDNQ